MEEKDTQLDYFKHVVSAVAEKSREEQNLVHREGKDCKGEFARGANAEASS